MADVTPINGTPYPELTDEPNVPYWIQQIAAHLDDRVIPAFPSTTDRDAAIPAPTLGMACHVAGYGKMTYCHHNAWVPEAGTQVAVLTQAAAQSIAHNTETAATFAAGSQTYLPFGGHSTSSNNTRLVAPFPGRYAITGVGGFDPSSTGYRQALVRKNGSGIAGSQVRNIPLSAVWTVGPTVASASLNGTTDYVELALFHTHGSNLSTAISAAVAPRLEVTYLGPAYGVTF
jgi:hypothetical protein